MRAFQRNRWQNGRGSRSCLLSISPCNWSHFARALQGLERPVPPRGFHFGGRGRGVKGWWAPSNTGREPASCPLWLWPVRLWKTGTRAKRNIHYFSFLTCTRTHHKYIYVCPERDKHLPQRSQTIPLLMSAIKYRPSKVFHLHESGP